MRKPTIWISIMVDTNQPVQSQKQAKKLEITDLRSIGTVLSEKRKQMRSFTVTAKLVCAFVFAYANCW